MRTRFALPLTMFFLALGAAGAASASELTAQATAQTAALEDVLEAVTNDSGQRFLVDRQVAADVVVGPFRTRDITLALLHSVLRNNGLAAVEIEGVVNIVPVPLVRQFPLRRVDEDDDSVPEDEWVVRVLGPDNVRATALVPILRPLIGQPGFLAAHAESNSLIITAPYAVARQLARLIEDLDRRHPLFEG